MESSSRRTRTLERPSESGTEAWRGTAGGSERWNCDTWGFSRNRTGVCTGST